MAWSLVSSTKYDSGATTNTDFSVGLTTHSSGDVAIITAYKDQDLGDWSTSSSGWDLILSKRATSGRDRSTAVFYKVLGSSESDPTIVYSDATNEEISWTLHIFRPPSGRTASQSNVITDWANSNDQNVQNPTFPALTTIMDDSAIFCIQMQTHDDCTEVGAPSGYTIGETIYGGSKDNRQQLAFYNLDVGTAGTKSPGEPTSSWNNNTSEYSIYDMTLEVDPNIWIDDQSDKLLFYGDTNKTVNGDGFDSTQGNGKVEIGSTSDYATATLKLQSIDSWSDTSIQFDTNLSGFSEGWVYIYVTNDSNDITNGYKVVYGEMPYEGTVKSLNPDIYHRFNNSYIDEMGIADANSQTSSGSFGFQSSPITKDNAYAWAVDDNDSRIEMNDTDYTNTSVRRARTVGGWIQLDRVHKVPSGFYEEGGGVNNMYMVVGYGNTILANLADSGGSPVYKIQGFSDIKLSTNRPYHLMMKFNCSSSTGADDGRFYFYVDGEKVSNYAGLESIPNQIKDTVFSNHSGDWSYGKPDANLDTGGTDIRYPGASNTLLSDWATWSDYNIENIGAISDADIRKLFIAGAIPTNEISSDTPTNMQTDIDSLANTSYTDKPLPIKIKKPTTSGDLDISFDNIMFDERCSTQVVWLGTGTLTITNLNGSNTEVGKCDVVNGGDISVITPSTLTISGQVDGSDITVLNHSTKAQLGHTASSSGDYELSVQVSAVDVIVIADDYVIIQKFDVDTTNNASVQIVQEKDYIYDNPI